MSNNPTPQSTFQQGQQISAVSDLQNHHTDELRQLRQQTDKVIKSILPIMSGLRRESAELKAQLAEAQKKS